jgi:hypothetical protein
VPSGPLPGGAAGLLPPVIWPILRPGLVVGVGVVAGRFTLVGVRAGGRVGAFASLGPGVGSTL